MPLTPPFRILVPGADAILTAEPSHTHTLLVEHDADDQPYGAPSKVLIRQECLVHVMDLQPCPHGWQYDPVSRALARSDYQGMIDALQTDLRANLDRRQLEQLAAEWTR